VTLTLGDVERARATVAPHVHRTPLLSSATLGRLIGAQAFLKAESLQRTGSFKVRGATNAVAGLTDAQRAAGLVTMSAGNHAQAVAFAARAYGARVVVAMPETASVAKIEATRAYGAEIVFAPDMRGLMPIVERLQGERGMTLVHPFDDERVIAGQGTVALEVLEDLPEADLIVVPVGGGGLIAGIALAATERRPAVRVVGVEPVGAAAVRRALDAGATVPLERVETVADGLAAPYAGERPLAIIRDRVADVVTVEDAVIVDGLRFLADRARLVVEPAGAAAVGALISGAVRVNPGERVVAVISGGNVDAARYATLLRPA
jgi:threonine dehydratase